MILTIIISVLFLLMLVYTCRHLIFTYSTLFGKSQSFVKSFKRIAGVFLPKVSILIPAHNEEFVIGNLLDRMTELTYPKNKLEVILIDDGSIDTTGQIADDYARNFSFIKAIHRPNGGGGKPAALNDGIKFTTGEIILTFDADYYPQLDIVEKLVAPFVDPEVGAVQGRVIVMNEEDSIVSKIVTLERIGGYKIDQEARDRLVLVPQYGGTVGGFRREALEKVGGWDRNMLTEDTDLTIRLVLKGYQIRYVNDAESYEESVTTWRAYWNQRYRWTKGHMQCATKHLKNVLKAPFLSGYEKVELTLLLCIYFMPIFVLVAWGVEVASYITPEETFLSINIRGYYFFISSIFTYSTVGNLFPFFEVGLGAYLDNRKRLLWLLPVFTFSFLIMALCCTKALIDLSLTRNCNYKWNHTHHKGNSNGNGHNGKNGQNGSNGFYKNRNGRLIQ